MIKAIDLIGDSIFDNQPYVDSGDSVIEQISVISPFSVNLLAVDGDTTIHCLDVLKQQGGAKADIGAVLSIGGNDALQSSPVLSEPTNNVFEALTKLGLVMDTFRRNYLLVLKKMLEVYEKDLIRVCTIYNKIPTGPTLPKEALTALAFFNDVITEEVNRLGLPLIDLRVICDSTDCYSGVSPIEPSKEGGRRITQAILHSFKEG